MTNKIPRTAKLWIWWCSSGGKYEIVRTRIVFDGSHPWGGQTFGHHDFVQALSVDIVDPNEVVG